ncbi:MAG: hypothetical protein ACOZDY_15065 [Pseudomonadota bacterium]
MSIGRWLGLLPLIVCTSVPLGSAAADAILEQAKELLARKDPKAAYALLEPLEPQRAGDPEYDFLLGISAIDQLAASDRPQVTGYLELGGGYDSNVNSATGAGTVAVPGFGGGLFVLDPLSVKKADSYGQLSGGLSGRYPLGPGLAAVGGLRGYLRRNDTEDRFDTDETAGDIGLNVTRGRTSYLVAVQGSEF